MDAGWRGEGHYTADRVAYVKTHDPMYERFSRDDFKFDAVVHIVRNPFDAIASLFHFQELGQHNATVLKYAHFCMRHVYLTVFFMRLCMLLCMSMRMVTIMI